MTRCATCVYRGLAPEGSSRSKCIYRTYCVSYDGPVEEIKIKKKTNKNQAVMETQEIKTTKRCPRCGRELPLDAFSKNVRTPDGLQRWCRECMSVTNSSRQKRQRAERRAAKAGDSANVGKIEQAPAKRIVVREQMTAAEMVAKLREMGYEVKCTKTEVVEL